MKHMACGKVALLGVFSLAGCYSYASEAINNSNYKTVQASPDFIFVKVGDSTQMIMRLINDNDNGAITSYAVGGVPSGIAVHYNAKYRPIIPAGGDTLVNTTDKNAQQYYVLGLTPGKYTFTVTPTSVNTGVSATVTVVVAPADLGLALSESGAGQIGDTLVLTAPPGTVFSQTSTITFPTGPAVVIVSRAADSTSITFAVGAGTSGVATVTGVKVLASPTVLPATLATTNTLSTPGFPTPIPATFSTLNPALGQLVTVTLGGGLRFLANSGITVTSPGDTTVATIISMSADSTSAVFLPDPAANGDVTLQNLAFSRFPSGVLASGDALQNLTVIAPTVAPTTVSNAAPNVGQSITLALGGNLRFLGNSHVFIGGTEAGIQSVSADSSTATIMPMMGSTGAVTYTNIALSNLNTIPLNLPSNGQNITVTTVYAGGSDPNATLLATASTLTLPPPGRSFIFTDSGPLSDPSQCGGSTGDGCRVYMVVLTGPTTYDIEFRWQGGSDNGLYRLNSTGATASSQGGCDNGGQGASGQPETCTVTALPAGTYFFAAVFFGTGSGYPPSANTVPPAFYQFRVTVH